MTNAKPTLLSFACTTPDAPSWPPASPPYEAAIKSTYCRPVLTPMTKSAT